MTEWTSYDTIAARYDDVWGSRFQAAARLLSERLALPVGASVLDVGTGTGIVLAVLAYSSARLTGCERSLGMIRLARARVPTGRFVEADATSLPFRDASFDAVTASFVLSHLGDPATGLREARRVLKPGGRFGMTSWAADPDERAEAWRELLAGAVSGDLLQAAVARVAPHESHFESAARVEETLIAAGLTDVEVHVETLRYTMSLDELLADREISSAGRFARHTLGADAWSRWVEGARRALERRFGSVFECSRRFLIAVGTRPRESWRSAAG
jgi:ubiquinone/menaquinone biosynthesis C-methylase UbiE